MLAKDCKMPDLSDLEPSVVGCFLAASLVGAETLKKREQMQRMAIASRIVDKARHEYLMTRKAVLDEVSETRMSYDEIIRRGNGQYFYTCKIINHFENCINALARLYRTVGKKTVLTEKIKNMRDSVEHMDERITEGADGPIVLDVAEDASEFHIHFRNWKTKHVETIAINTSQLANEIRFLNNYVRSLI
jgi:hypothetical protein